MIKVETLGSYWLIDSVNKTFQRMPKGEQPREKPEWGDARAKMMQDFIPHSYKRISIVYRDRIDILCNLDSYAPPALKIVGEYTVRAPEVIITNELLDLIGGENNTHRT